ncbi:Transcriptional regulator, GntR family domain / Aspartate aminotransferase [Acidisarcina polymorpha]|uniref:Transcriptional regulator, GntR family domain / Aspartate aminotransferase n=1 Tax=Acidisarcina polymorpha TaxID=2211140 RepID=A0A2Z5FSC4_9BACT|nr:PLP-dependent aminotransferase family protein [Acidisarcina polymorpha]AXC09718.1 Transcriptional regulator, GntR family domain / Aspartate aminotransferase [Acidisarcina polymorpha]
MPKSISSFELTLKSRARNQTLTNWLYGELRSAILDGRLAPGARLPASRDFASQDELSRGTVVSVLERLQAEGYISSRIGFGTWVNRVEAPRPARLATATPAYIRGVISTYKRPKPWVDLPLVEGIRPFRIGEPAINEFPSELWGRVAAHRARNFGAWLKKEADPRGYRPLRDAIAEYLRTSRGVRCTAEQIIVVSGIQQALDLLARLLLKKSDPVWIEDPGYFGASIAFDTVGAKIIPVPVNDEGISVSAGIRICPDAKGAYVTPAHQFPLGVTMSLERRMALLSWASRAGAFVIEDDYDSEYRFEGPPVPALQSLDNHSSVIFIGSFSKTLFPALRVGYMVLPAPLIDHFLGFRYRTDFRNSSFDQAVLCDFIIDGHLARHLRRMRNLYAERLATLIEGARQHLGGLLEISNVRAGLYTIGYLKNQMTSRQAERLAAAQGVEVLAVDRFTVRGPDPNALLLGFGGFDELAIRQALIRLAKALR